MTDQEQAQSGVPDEKYTIPRIDRLLAGEDPNKVFDDPAPTEATFPGARAWNDGSHNHYLLWMCMLSWKYPAPCVRLCAQWCALEITGEEDYKAGFMGNELTSPTYGGWIWGSLVRVAHHARAARVEPDAQRVVSRWLLRMALLGSLGSPARSLERGARDQVTFDGVGGLMAGMRGSPAKFAEPQLARVLTPAFGIDPRIPSGRIDSDAEFAYRLTRGLPPASFGLTDRTTEACRRLLQGEAPACPDTLNILATAFHSVPGMVDYQVGRSGGDISTVLWRNANGNTGPLSATRAPAGTAEWVSVAAFRPDLFHEDLVAVGRKHLVDGVAPCRVLYCSSEARWRSNIGPVPVEKTADPVGTRCADACSYQVAMPLPADLPLCLTLGPSQGAQITLDGKPVPGTQDLDSLLPAAVG
ncbi:MAG: hypothetical protein SX243_12325 [Acidobacteriota bacterium]|nr:hypothetical protein [Acidobacteriota bacterium]